MDTVSVILPFYDSSRTIRRAVDSVLGQSYPHIEIVAVDDGSTDDSAGIVEGYRDPRIKLRRMPHKGLIAAYKEGIGKASGEYVMMIDGDDEYEPTFVEDMLGQMKSAGASCVASACVWIEGNGQRIEEHGLKTGFYEVRDISCVCRKALRDQFDVFPTRWNRIYKRSILLGILDSLDESLGVREDNILNYLYMRAGKTIFVANGITGYRYHINEGSMSREFSPTTFSEHRASIRYLYELSSNGKECGFMLIDSVHQVLVAAVRHGVRYHELATALSEILDDELIQAGMEGMRRYSLPERMVLFLIRHRLSRLLFLVYSLWFSRRRYAPISVEQGLDPAVGLAQEL